jgi:S-DNA-T family DNA segregation ATPase FtsK/SpoIIIE
VLVSKAMSAVQKRRSSSRVKTQRSAKVAPSRAKSASSQGTLRPHMWVRDVISLMLFATAIVVLLALSSYGYTLVSGKVIVPTDNIMGPLGHVLATLLAGTFGLAALLPVGALVWLALFRNRGGEERPRLYSVPVVVVSLGAVVIGTSSFLALLGDERWGGTLGGAVKRSLLGTFGSGGAFLWVLLVCAVSVAILAQRSVGDVAHGLRWVVQTGCAYVFVRMPLAAARILTNGVRVATGMSVRGLKGFARMFVSRSVPTVGESALPRPRLRKNMVPAEPSLEPLTSRPFELPASRGAEPPVAYERADPIIVKPKPSEPVVAKKVRGSTNSKPSKGEKDSAPQGAPAFESYVSPDVALLNREESDSIGEDDEELRQKAEQIEAKLRDFNIAGRVTQVHPGPVITLFEFEPAPGVKVGRIAALQDDLSMSLRASSIRIIAPIPKRGTVGIEVPNKHRAMVRLRECLESEAFVSADSVLSVPLGKDTYGDSVVVDIATMPHLLMAGATGTGKSVCINALLLSLLYRAHPSELGLILIDPKVLELSIYDGIPHLRVPVVTDPRQAKAVLSWAVKEMDRRYRYMQKFGVRNIDGYNQLVAGGGVLDAKEKGADDRQEELPLSIEPSREDDARATPAIEPVAPEQLKPLPKLVIVIDELADLMLTVGREIEELITRLAQKARAAGIHLIVATQRPSVDVITGLIKANFPARLSFRVSSRIDSRTILDSMGAEKLLGKGDMLFMLPGAVPLKRVHGAFVSDLEVQKVVSSLKTQCAPQYDENIISACEKALAEDGATSGEGGTGEEGGGEEFDQFYDKAVELVLEKGSASTSMIQRVFRIGYNRAARIIETMEREGVVGKTDGVRPREILINSPVREPES